MKTFCDQTGLRNAWWDQLKQIPLQCYHAPVMSKRKPQDSHFGGKIKSPPPTAVTYTSTLQIFPWNTHLANHSGVLGALHSSSAMQRAADLPDVMPPHWWTQFLDEQLFPTLYLLQTTCLIWHRTFLYTFNNALLNYYFPFCMLPSSGSFSTYFTPGWRCCGTLPL